MSANQPPVLSLFGQPLDLNKDPAAIAALLAYSRRVNDATLYARILREVQPALAAAKFDYSTDNAQTPALPRTIGGQIIFTAHEYSSAPSWVDQLSAKLAGRSVNIFRPDVNLFDYFDGASTLGRRFLPTLNTTAARVGTLPEWTARPISEVAEQVDMCIASIKRGDHTLIRILSSFILIRSSVALVDLTALGYGGHMFYANLAEQLDIPTIGISNRAEVSPEALYMTALTTTSVVNILRLIQSWLFL